MPAGQPAEPSAEPSAILADLPEPPKALGLKLGDSLASLQIARPAARPDTLTPALLLEDLPADGHFSLATYLLSQETPPRLRTIILRFRAPFGEDDRFAGLVAAVTDRFGAGSPAAHEGYAGVEWAVPGHRIELRRDTRDGNTPQLVFDLRGGRQIEMP